MSNESPAQDSENPSSSSRSNKQPKRTKFIRFVGRTMLVVIILLGLGIIINWLLITPTTPSYCVENGYFHTHSLTDRKLNATFSFRISCYNGNRKAKIDTDNLKMTTTYKDQSVSTAISPFLQPPGNRTSFDVSVEANFVSPFGDMEKAIEGEGIDVTLHLTGGIRYAFEKWTSKHRIVEVYCPSVMLLNHTSKTFERACCKVDL